jgi:type IV pilus assembly protein PilN
MVRLLLNTIPDYQANLAAQQAELRKYQEQTQKGSGAQEEIRKYKEEQSRLQSQVNTIEQLKKDRLREVRILDTMQKEMPNRLWLSKIELTDGNLSLAGVAGTDPDLTAFMDVLSRSAYLKEVNLIRANEYATQVGVFKKFEINCLTER